MQPSGEKKGFKKMKKVFKIKFCSGWGRPSNEIWSSSPILRAVQNTVITNDECRFVYGSMIIDSTLCKKSNGEATCHGDSGLFKKI